MREPDALDSLRVLALGLLAYVGLAYLPRIFPGVPPPAVLLLIHISLLAIPLAYARLARLKPFQASGYARLRGRQVALVLLAALGSMWVMKGLLDLQQAVFRELWPEAEHQRQQLAERVVDLRRRVGPVSIAILVLAPAVCEETFYRGILFRGLARWNAPAALLGTAALFAVMHYRVQWGLMLFTGVYFGLVVWLTRSLWAGVLAHAVNNLAVVVSYDLFGERLYQAAAPVWMVALSAGVFVSALALLALERRAEAPESPGGTGSPAAKEGT